MFSYENTRYNRQIQMREWGLKEQNKISKAKVVVIGAGGVKSSLLYALTCAGVGYIRIIDFDKVELSNLNRQFLYTTKDIGKYKATESVKKLRFLNPDIIIEPIIKKLTAKNIHSLLKDFDFVVEGGDSPYGRNLVNEYCLAQKKTFRTFFCSI